MLAKDKGVQPMVRPCGIYTQVRHPTNICLMLQEYMEAIQAMGGFSSQQQNNFQPWSNQIRDTNLMSTSIQCHHNLINIDLHFKIKCITNPISSLIINLITNFISILKTCNKEVV